MLVSCPTPSDRVRRGHGYPETGDASDFDYANGFKDAVRQSLGTDAWFALVCDLDGNPLPQLRIRLSDAQRGEGAP